MEIRAKYIEPISLVYLRISESRKVVLHAGREKKKMWGRQHTQQLDIYLNTSSLFFGLYRDGWMDGAKP
jgi:hypothetical protein